MAKKYGGLVGVAHADTSGGSYTDVVGPFSDDTNITVPNTKTNTTTGMIFGGGSIEGDIGVKRDDSYAALEALMLADTRKFWRFTYEDGTVIRTQKAFNCFVEQDMTPDARTGVRGFRLTFNEFTYRPMMTTV